MLLNVLFNPVKVESTIETKHINITAVLILYLLSFNIILYYQIGKYWVDGGGISFFFLLKIVPLADWTVHYKWALEVAHH